MNFEQIKSLAAKKGIKTNTAGDRLFFATPKHWVSIYVSCDGAIVLDKESRESGICSRRKAHDVCTIDPSDCAIRRTINNADLTKAEDK